VTIPTTRSPTEAEIAAINARHLIETPLRPADLLFVFGTREDVDERVDEACRLWREGFFRWAIVSGGVTPGSDLSECEIIAGAMVARGVPADLILREDCAMNTGENVIFSLPVIDRALGLANIRSVICLGNSWTARRYPMTLHRHWPEVEKMLVMVDSFRTRARFGTPTLNSRAACSVNGTRSSRTRRGALSRSGRRAKHAIDSSTRSYRRLLSPSAFPRACAAPDRAVR